MICQHIVWRSPAKDWHRAIEPFGRLVSQLAHQHPSKFVIREIERAIVRCDHAHIFFPPLVAGILREEQFKVAPITILRR